MSCVFSWCEWVLWRVQIPLPYLKLGWLTTALDGKSLAPHNTWEQLWYVLDHEALSKVCGLLSVPKECRAHCCNICPCKVVENSSKHVPIIFIARFLSTLFIIWLGYIIYHDPPICMKGLWEQIYDTLKLRGADDSKEESLNNLCEFLDVLSVL